jgi:hypothetical protein
MKQIFIVALFCPILKNYFASALRKLALLLSVILSPRRRICFSVGHSTLWAPHPCWEMQKQILRREAPQNDRYLQSKFAAPKLEK